MSLTPGYNIISELSNDGWFVCYRAQRVADGCPVLLKAAHSRPDRRALSDELQREYAVLHNLDVAGVLRAREVLGESTNTCLVFDDPGALPLRSVIDAGTIDVPVFLHLVLQLSETLAELHGRQIIHRQVHTDNILLHPQTHQAWLVGFTAASGVEGEIRGSPLPRYQASALGYISPEQTGRTNRPLDHRTDLYSLGIVCYELLTGVVPFRATDPIQLIHAHIAKAPASPGELRPEIPDMLSRIVLKLLEKMPDARYQSAKGLHADLQHCAKEWNSTSAITRFELGAWDVPERLLIPQRLYGREHALQTLVNGFEDACKGSSSLTLVTGYAGVGKTSLIHDLYPWIAKQHAYYIVGKFDQVVRNVPYGAIVQALRTLVREILGESDASFDAWKERLSAALGSNAGVLTDVIPEIKLIIGEPPSYAPLPAAESQNRFRLVFQNFVAALSSAERPLVLFLDDLQWADPASLALLQPLLTSPEVRFLFVIGAYRDNEVDASHTLTGTLARLNEVAKIVRIDLRPLERSVLRRFAADCLRRDDEDSQWLADLLAQKTEGNPFFMIQFLKSLWRDDLISFEKERRNWSLEKDQIRKMPITENVVDLMTRRIERLSAPARRALTFAACIGNAFDLRTLAVATQIDEDELLHQLNEVRDEGLIIELETDAGDRGPSYAFLHDRVQQAAYAQLEENRRQSLHLAVGRLLLADSYDDVADDRIFDVIEHLNIGRDLITDTSEHLNLAQLNYQAGIRAKSATAHQAALGYFTTGCKLLAENSWDTQYELMFELGIEAAECAYLCGSFSDAEMRFEALLSRAQSTVDKARVYALRVVQRENMSEFASAAHLTAEGLDMLGISFPDEATSCQAALDAEIDMIERRLAGRSIESLVTLPEMEDLEKRMTMRLLTVGWASSYISGEGIPAALISARMVSLSIEFGSTADSAYGYVTHAITIGPTLGDYASAYEWGTLALAINARFDDHAGRAKIHQQFNAHVTLWRKPLDSCLVHAREACRAGMQNGDFTYAAYGAFTESWPAFLLSRDLDRFVRDMEPNGLLLLKLRTVGLAAAHQVMLQWARAMLGRTYEPVSLTGGDFEEEDFLHRHGENPFFMTVYSIAKLSLAVLFDDTERAIAAREQAERIGWGHGTIWPVLLRFWGSLARLRVYDASLHDNRDAEFAVLVESREFFEKLANNCPENFRCMFLIVSAGIERTFGEPWRSSELLDEAVKYAVNTQNLQLEALAQEHLAVFWHQRGNGTVARAYVKAACRSYRKLGAAAKVEQLEKRYPALLATPADGAGLPIDIDSVTKAAHAVAKEIVLEALLRRILSIAMENAGARRAFFIQEKDGELVIEAEADVDGESSEILAARQLDSSSALSTRVVNYVRKTGESVVVGNAAADNRFGSDPYVVSTQPKSIACLPVEHQGKLGGILYLENDLSTDAFTTEHLKVLDVLCAQAAISLENSRLYHEMREEIERRKEAETHLRDALDEVEELKNRLSAENVYLQEEIKSGHNFEEIVGDSPALLEILGKVDLVARSNSTVLINGETGTGKELIARALHDRSTRRDRPLVKVNCGAISAGLVESELFGHVKGAFTGALARRAGRFELADGGTIFLDEVGELPADVQVKLLRVLQEHEFEPVGSSKSVHVDVRVIAASNRDLDDQVRAGRFRADLFYRLNVIPLTVPPLRNRREDIPKLAMFFLERNARSSGSPVQGIDPATMRLLCAYDWPGNVRELQNVIERAVVLSSSNVLHLDPHVFMAPGKTMADASFAATAANGPRPLSDLMSMEEMERRHILAALDHAGWVIEGPQGAARLLEQNPSTLRSRMKKLGICRVH